MQATSLVLVAACAAICGANRAAAAAANEGDNAAAYATLCSAVAVLSRPYAAPATAELNPAILSEAQALNFSLHHPEAAAELAAENVDSRDKLKKEGKAHKLTSADTFNDYKAKAKTAAAMAKERHYARLKRTPINAFLISQITSVITSLETAYREATALDTKQKATDANKKMNQALYGTETADNTVKVALTDGDKTREKLCGKPGDANVASAAGTSLKQDIMCLCAIKGGGGGATACATFTAALSKQGDADVDLAEDWAKLKERCGSLHPETEPTATTIRATAAAVTTAIARSTDTAGKVTHLLGKTTDHANTGSCVGDTATGSGTCVYYGRGTAANIKYQIAWIDNMLAAARAIDDAEATAKQKEELVDKITKLNSTLASLAKAAMEAPTAASPTTERAPQQPATKTAEDKEKVCNAVGSDEGECDKLKDKGCIFNKQDKKCTLSDKAKETAKEAETQPGKDDKTTNTTASSNSFVIHKAPLLLAFFL
uniref:Variant surface glycoprotein 550 n=1 Tax=Trypanosoma brucei TaxID=5691 RepID=M4SXB4_9TRYP|nr:variant surface glycoprotein 550 [Trypanosoma brucei]